MLMNRSAFAALSASILAVAILTTSAVHPPHSGAQEPVSLAVDADPSENTATSLGPTDQCVAVQPGESFQVDIIVRDVEDLLGWEAQVIYDVSVLRLTDRDVKLFLAANAGSNIFDASDPTPDTDGRYRIAGADIADPPAPDSGSGVLARLTFEALSPGVSLIALPLLDSNGDGRPDFGPILTTVSGERVGDSDGDTLYDGPTSDAWIAVGTACPAEPPPLPTVGSVTPVPGTAQPPRPSPSVVPSPTPTPPPAAGSGSDGGPPWALIGGLAGGAVVLAAGGTLWRLRTRPRR